MSGRPLEFAHPIIRKVVYEDLPAARRSELHARAASAPSTRAACGR